MDIQIDANLYYAQNWVMYANILHSLQKIVNSAWEYSITVKNREHNAILICDNQKTEKKNPASKIYRKILSRGGTQSTLKLSSELCKSEHPRRGRQEN